ncbi:MAG TPA: serine protease [Kofleriaceae bacterium]|jgi:serine protease Do|nr:serine protease [Kofleriaceae bacterium]
MNRLLPAVPVLAALPCLAIAWLGAPRAAAADPAPACAGDYAEDLSALSPRARAIEAAGSSYSYAVRTSATYECVSYGSDGNLKRTRSTALAYGTAFGYRRDGGDTLLLTNEHVADWPVVTDDDHPVDGIAAGCKRVADALKIVDNDHDDYAADDIPLTKVVVDPALDVAVLRAHAKLEIIPWRIGRSAALAARNAVQVKGYPLGEFQATNVGKVVSPYDRDTQGVRNHDDFIVDALLTSGGSGSPVFAVSCKTGEFELVGIFHARYVRASALNVVVAIDQVRDLMTTLKRSPRPADRSLELDAAARGRLIDAVHGDPDPPYFAVGPLVGSLHVRRDGALVFALFASDFPRTSGPLLAIEDLAAADPAVFGALGAVYLGSTGGLHAYPTTESEAEVHALLSRTLTALRESAIAAFEYRGAKRTAADSRSAFDRAAERRRMFERTLDAQRDTAQAIVDLVGRETPKAAGAALGLADLEAEAPTPTPVATTTPG